MKKLLILPLLLTLQPAFGAGLSAYYQASTRAAHLTWTASTDGGTVNVYRATGDCTATSFTKLASTVVAAGPYDDSTVTVSNAVGNNSATYCYYVTAVVNGAESVPSNKVAVKFTSTVLPQPPTGLTGTGN